MRYLCSLYNHSHISARYFPLLIVSVLIFQVFGRQNNTEAQITAVTQKTLEMQNESVRQHRDATVQVILEKVLNIAPQVHINYHPKQKA